MKKLMIAASVALMAACSQAATMNWGTGTMYKPVFVTDTTTKTTDFQTGNSGKAASGVSVYLWELTDKQYEALFVADDYAASAKKVFAQYATINDETGRISVNTGWTTSGKTSGSSSAKSFADSAGNTWGVGDTAYAAMIMTYTDTNNKDYYIANLGSYTWAADATGERKAFGTNEFGNPNNTALSGWNVAQPSAVPEPTSGLLLLLGVAGLALRRRRA